MITVRAYMPGDFQMVNEWAKARGLILTPELLSKTGFLAEDDEGPCSVVWVYLMFDVPIASLDYQLTRPGLNGRKVISCWRLMWACAVRYLHALKDTDGNSLHYSVIRSFVNEKMAPLTRKEGWFVAEQRYCQAMRTLPSLDKI